MQEDFFNKIFTSHFICKVWKGLLKVCVWEGAGDQTELKYFDPHSYGRQRCLSHSPDAQPEALGSTLLGAGFLYCIFSGPGPQGPFGLMWLSLPHLVYNSISSSNWNSTELYNSSTPTRSLEWHDWSSSSGNNCHAVHRSLSSGASPWNGIFGRVKGQNTTGGALNKLTAFPTEENKFMKKNLHGTEVDW